MKMRDEKGRYVSPSASAMLVQAEELQAKASELIAAENDPPQWLRGLVVTIALAIGITPEELQARVRVVHPTPQDPVLLVDGRPVVSWV